MLSASLLVRAELCNGSQQRILAELLMPRLSSPQESAIHCHTRRLTLASQTSRQQSNSSKLETDMAHGSDSLAKDNPHPTGVIQPIRGAGKSLLVCTGRHGMC
jgi:hypothetical protein